jgi:hypothetical protein
MPFPDLIRQQGGPGFFLVFLSASRITEGTVRIDALRSGKCIILSPGQRCGDRDTDHRWVDTPGTTHLFADDNGRAYRQLVVFSSGKTNRDV